MTDKELFCMFGLEEVTNVLDSLELIYSTQWSFENITFGCYVNDKETIELLCQLFNPVIIYYGSDYFKSNVENVIGRCLYHPWYEDNIYIIFAAVPTLLYAKLLEKNNDSKY